MADVITARFSSRCKRCQKWIVNSEKAEYSKETGITHVSPAACEAAYPSKVLPVLQDVDRMQPAYWAMLEKVGRLLEAHEFTYAKTMPHIPHFYTMRHQWKDQDAYSLMVEQVRILGTRRKFRGSAYDKLDINQYYYWSMEPRHAPAVATTLVNRAVKWDYEDPPAPWWNTWPEYSNEQQRWLARAVSGLRGKDVLDIGGLWTAAAEWANRYVAIGPPGDMERLRSVATDARTINTVVDAFVPVQPQRFDLVAALYGVASRLSTRELARLPLLVRQGGHVLLMFDRKLGHLHKDGLFPGAIVKTGRHYVVVVTQGGVEQCERALSLFPSVTGSMS